MNDNGDPYNPASAAFIGQQACEQEATAEIVEELVVAVETLLPYLRHLEKVEAFCADNMTPDLMRYRQHLQQAQEALKWGRQFLGEEESVVEDGSGP